MTFPITYKEYAHQIKKTNDGVFIFCVIRKKWLVLTPEEWVRQNFLWYLIEEKNYPQSLMAVEKSFVVEEKQKRFDIVIFNTNQTIELLVECKKQTEVLNQKVLQQAITYYTALQSKFVAITNGNTAACISFINTPEFLSEIVVYNQ